MSNMSHVQILVDDTDPRIVYTSGWTKSGSLFEHDFTISRISQTSGSFSFSFNGTSIVVYATIPDIDANDPQAPKITCKVDGLLTKVNTSPQSQPYNYAQCGASVANDREHTLVVDVNSASAAWSLDYLIYDAVVSDDRLVGPDDTPVQIIVDDTDSQFEYSDQEWHRGGMAPEYDQSVHWTRTAGAWTKFTFYGSAVQIYGTIPNSPFSGVISTYSLMDGGSAIRTYVNPREENDIHRPVWQTRFVNFDSLEEAEHTLVITVPIGSPAANQYTQDFAVYSIKPSSLLLLQKSTLGPALNSPSEAGASGQPSPPISVMSPSGSLGQPSDANEAPTDSRGSSHDSNGTASKDSLGSGAQTNATGSPRPSVLVQSLGVLETQSGSYTSRSPLESSQTSPSDAERTSDTSEKSPVPPITIIAPIVAVLVSIVIALILIALHKKRRRNKKLHRARAMAAQNVSGSLENLMSQTRHVPGVEESGDLPPLTYAAYPLPRDGKRTRRDDTSTESTQPLDSDEMAGVGGSHWAHLTQNQGAQAVLGSFGRTPVNSTDRLAQLLRAVEALGGGADLAGDRRQGGSSIH